jgi:hypothetical protein
VSAYRHGRPHVGYDALMANALLTFSGALGYVTELLSGDFATPFGRSSHHQVWSQAMVISPILKGLLGIEAADGGRTLVFAPALPATWDRVAIRSVRAGTAVYDITFERSGGRAVVRVTRGEGWQPGDARRLVVAPAFATDARVGKVTVNGAAAQPRISRLGDVQRAEVSIQGPADTTEVVFRYDEGTEVQADIEAPLPGASNQGLRILRVSADANALHLTAEGRGDHAYIVRVRSPRRAGPADGVRVLPPDGRDQLLEIRFEGSAESYVRREIVVPLRRGDGR